MRYWLILALLSHTLWGQLANTTPTLPNAFGGGNLTPNVFYTAAGGWTSTTGFTVDTTYPTQGGTVRPVHNGSQLQAALTAAQPGDTIVCDANVDYVAPSQGWVLPDDSSNPGGLWKLIVTSDLASLPTPGNRVDPSFAPHMCRIRPPHNDTVGPLTGTAIQYPVGTKSKWRLVGIEIPADGGLTCSYNDGVTIPNCYAPFLVQMNGGANLILDRVYVHGTDDLAVTGTRKDTLHAIEIYNGAGSFAMVDSNCSQIHAASGLGDTNCVLAFQATGPILLLNDYFSSTGENVLFGGSPNPSNTTQPADVQLKGDNFGGSDPAWLNITWNNGSGPIEWQNKTNVEFKSCNRCILEGSILQNQSQSSSEHGQNIRVTPRTNQSGNNAVADNITIISNQLLSANLGIIEQGWDNSCNSVVPGCTNPGEGQKHYYGNNLIVTRDQALPGNNTATSFGSWGIEHSFGYQNLWVNHNTIWTNTTLGSGTLSSDVANRWNFATGSPTTATKTQLVNFMVNSGGSGYAVNDTGTITASGCTGVTYTVTAVSSGVVTAFNSNAYSPPGTYGCSAATNQATTRTTGSGSGLTVDMKIAPLQDNTWIQSNVLWSETNSDGASCLGGSGLQANCMINPVSAPNDFNTRFNGNLMYVPSGSAHTYPTGNSSSTSAAAFNFVNSVGGNYTLATPYLTTPDGNPAGMDYASMCGATAKAFAGTTSGTVSCGGDNGVAGFQGVVIQGVVISH